MHRVLDDCAALALPVPVPAALQFLLDHTCNARLRKGHLFHDLPQRSITRSSMAPSKVELGAPALNTMLHRLSGLSKAHQMCDVLNPTRDAASGSW